jgi:hypothetical protein
MRSAFRCGVKFWYGQAEPRRLCRGLKARFALMAPMPERPFSSAQPIISLPDTASPSKPWTVRSPDLQREILLVRLGIDDHHLGIVDCLRPHCRFVARIVQQNAQMEHAAILAQERHLGGHAGHMGVSKATIAPG